MRQSAGQLADRLHFLGLKQGFAGLFKRQLRLLLFRNVTGDLAETDKRAKVVADRRQDRACPKQAAVLPDAPAFRFKPPLARGDFKRLARLVLTAVFFRVEQGKGLSNDLLPPVALDFLRTQIPVADPALLIQHKNRVVRDALHQQPELFLALPDRALCHFPLGQVPGNLGKPQQVARGCANRVDDHMGPEAAAVLAHSPAFTLKLSLDRGGLQGAGGNAALPVFAGVEDSEVLAKDLSLLIALKSLCPEVPGRNPAFPVEHENRIVGDSVDKEAIPFAIQRHIQLVG
ncbi:hypothetical protein GALL_502800 [mine drainage metagenome]|uniref:Uncharacterized protein n=1 Tax=mine drainage metagenome TaxID=410659 RepID=A0A1J5PA90_9ZZZZ